MSNEIFIRELQKLYNQNQIVPFLGAGLSVPFNIPDWAELIKDCAISMGIQNINGTNFLPMLELSLGNYDYWEAVRVIKKYLIRSDEDIQQYIVSRIVSNTKRDVENKEHNYSDLCKYGFDTFLTTNYDHVLAKYLNSDYMPINLKDVNSNMQSLITQNGNRRIFHLHGNISESSSIVISEEKYKELYNNNKYKTLFSLFTGVKTFLFIGFSFNDVFIQQIIKDNNEFFNSKHYIILANPTHENRVMLKEKYNIETIAYNPSNSLHAEEIRKILDSICVKSEDGTSTPIAGDGGVSIELVDTLPTTEKKKDMEKNLFCRKLRIEDIDDLKVDYSKECFFTAEQYFRWLKKSGIKNNEVIANHLLDMSYMKYKQLLIDEYAEHKNSNQFLRSVHSSLGKIEFPKLKKLIDDESMPNEVNKQGFVHVIADNNNNTEKEVWWGEKRIGQH
jgi:NAD-dependent SIR2 family protein deacetylase